ncbi:MAG: hypothetical protein ABR500_10870 [Dermatophilaceae bacterium]|nr:hypothetical protein [Intrasporangiaceae bacterium]
MDSSNHWYGHAHVLAEYCGLPAASPPPIQGILQHGWTFVHGFGYGHRPPVGFTRFVWSDVNRRRGQIVGWRDYYVIGAPFAYLMAMTPEPDVMREGTIWYPFHGTADYEAVEGNHTALIEEILDTEDDPVTVCLYYVEFEQPEIRRMYEDAGFRVISHGRRGAKWTGTTANFLHQQLFELRRHRRVASNRLSTAILYGLATGCEAGVYGDPMQFMDGQPGFVGDDLLTAWFPEFHIPFIDTGHGRDVAMRELGCDSLLSPEELRLVVGWSGRG